MRYQAINSLYPNQGPEELKLLAADSDASELERLFALLYWKKQSGPSQQTARALVDLYASASDPKIRAEAMESLRRHHQDVANVEAWLQFAGENDLDPSVRREAGRH